MLEPLPECMRAGIFTDTTDLVECDMLGALWPGEALQVIQRTLEGVAQVVNDGHLVASLQQQQRGVATCVVEGRCAVSVSIRLHWGRYWWHCSALIVF